MVDVRMIGYGDVRLSGCSHWDRWVGVVDVRMGVCIGVGGCVRLSFWCSNLSPVTYHHLLRLCWTRCVGET